MMAIAIRSGNALGHAAVTGHNRSWNQGGFGMFDRGRSGGGWLIAVIFLTIVGSAPVGAEDDKVVTSEYEGGIVSWARSVGRAIGTAFYDLGMEAKRFGSSIGESVATVGKDVGQGAAKAGKEVGQAAKEGGKAFGQAVTGNDSSTKQ